MKTNSHSRPGPAASCQKAVPAKPKNITASANTAEITKPEDDFTIGYGYDIFGKFADFTSKKTGQFFDFGKINAEEQRTGRKLIANENIQSSDYEFHQGHNLSELIKSYRLDAGLSAKIFQFAGEIKASFSSQHEEKYESEFAQASYKILTRRQYFNMECIDRYEKFMTDSAREAINGTDPYGKYTGEKGIEHLVKDYGTHVIVLAYMGGRVDYSMTIETSRIKDAYDLDAFINLGYSGFFGLSAKVEEKYKTSYEKNTTCCKERIKTLGGNNPVQDKKDLAEWSRSVYNGHHVLMGFESGSLRPIWEFCHDKNRQAAIKRYITGTYYSSKIGDLTPSKLIKFPVPGFTSSDLYLVKKVLIDGITVAEICNEYIPTLTKETRVTVVYPVIGGMTRLDKGLFIGNQELDPAIIDWSVSTLYPGISPIKDMKAAPAVLYKMRDKFYIENPDSQIYKVATGRLADQTAAGYRRKNYPVVKIGRFFWLGEDYSEEYTLTGKSLKHVVRHDPLPKYYDRIYYPINITHPSYRPFIPYYWEYIHFDQANYLVEYVGKGNESKLMLVHNGITGFNANTNGVGMLDKDKNFYIAERNLHGAYICNKRASRVWNFYYPAATTDFNFIDGFLSLRFVRNPDFPHK